MITIILTFLVSSQLQQIDSMSDHGSVTFRKCDCLIIGVAGIYTIHRDDSATHRDDSATHEGHDVALCVRDSPKVYLGFNM